MRSIFHLRNITECFGLLSRSRKEVRSDGNETGVVKLEESREVRVVRSRTEPLVPEG